jgi:hypothetical protein
LVFVTSNQDNGKCLSNGGDAANSAPITQYTCNNSANQIWYEIDNPDGTYEIQQYVGGRLMCLTDGGSHTNTTPITQYQCHGGNNQTWEDTTA